MTLFLPFPTPVVIGTFISRPQRFLVSTRLNNGSHILAYCANPGFFTPFRRGSPVLLWADSARTRKRGHTWRAIKIGRTWIGTDTHLANRLVEKALVTSRLPGLGGFAIEKKEPRGCSGRRLDFQLTNRRGRRCFLEVKSAMAGRAGYAQFPDSQSPRTRAHLEELAARCKAGERAVLLFLVQRGDVNALRINHAYDPKFSAIYTHARRLGVEVMAVRHAVSQRGFGPPAEIPIIDEACDAATLCARE